MRQTDLDTWLSRRGEEQLRGGELSRQLCDALLDGGDRFLCNSDAQQTKSQRKQRQPFARPDRLGHAVSLPFIHPRPIPKQYDHTFILGENRDPAVLIHSLRADPIPLRRRVERAPNYGPI